MPLPPRPIPKTTLGRLHKTLDTPKVQEQNVLFNTNIACYAARTNAAGLRVALETLKVSSRQVADWLGVSTRAVDMWLSGEREVPSPVAAYLNLVLSLPKALLTKELIRLKKEPEM